jgi:DNA polymerase III sliding clamp (beta) subunit (PCNA family)
MLIAKANVAELKTALKTVYSVLKGSEVLVVLDLGRGLLYGQDSDLDIALSADYLKAGDTHDLRLRVDAKKLHAVLTHARGDVQMVVHGQVLHLEFGSSKFDLPTTVATAPPLKEFKSPLAVPAAALGPVLRQALTVAASGSYGTVMVTGERGVLRAVATDGLRLIVADAPMERPQPIDALLISQRAAEAICELPGDTLHIFTDESSLVVDTGTARLVARRTSAKFPDYTKVIPVDIKREYVVKAEDMVAALDRLGAVIDEKQANVSLALTNDTASLGVPGGSDSVPLIGKSYEPNFDVDFDVMEDHLCFRHTFLTNFFNLCKGDVTIKIEDPKRPVLFENGPLKFIMASAAVPGGRQ